jgi:hypothetical protein
MSFRAFLWSGHHFCVFKGNFEKYKGKYAIGPFLLSFLTGRLNRLNFFARLLHLYYFFPETPILANFDAIWQYGLMAIFWPYGHIAIWPYGVKRHQYGCLLKQQYKCNNLAKELYRFDLSVRNESKNGPMAYFPLIFIGISFVNAKNDGHASFCSFGLSKMV